MKVFPITINIYAENEQEADNARRAIGGFIDQMGQIGIAVTGNKISEAVPKWDKNAFIKGQIINFFK